MASIEKRASRRQGSARAFAAALAAALTVGACESGAPVGPVAQVGTWSLSGARLADLLVLGQPLPLDSVTVGALVDQWVSMAALAQRADAGADLVGAEARDASLWLERRQALLDAERRHRLGADTTVSAGRAEAVFRADTLRLLAHVLRRTGPGASPQEKDLQRRTAQDILDDLLAGGSWNDAVARSEDAETRDEAGLLGLLRPEEVRAPLRAAAARLQPGQVSSLVESSLGFHILYRPRWEDVAPLYARLLSERLAQAADSIANRDLLATRHVRTAPEAAAAVRAMAEDPGGPAAPAGGAPLATWDGGALQPAVAQHYVTALPDEARRRLAGSSDEAATDFVRQLSGREIRVEDAGGEGLAPDPETLASLDRMHADDVAKLRAALDGGADRAPTEATVDRYMERLVARQVAFEPLPPLFRAWLLEPLTWSVDERAVRAATQEARGLLAASGSGAEGTGSR